MDKKYSKSIINKKIKNKLNSPDLDIEQVELYRVASVHILVRVEKLSPQQQNLVGVDVLFPQRLGVVQPVH